jgi:DNA (cytosine-5)-methyltransferase 1
MTTTCQPTFIDLFCGCGGFTLGMLRAGFRCKAAIDFNREAIAALKTNLKDNLSPALELTPVEHALECDLTKFAPQELAVIIGTHEIDVIVGGPPCQGFSTARQRDGSNHGTERLKDDPRRHLYRQFLDYVEHFRPKIFVIENVLGLRTAAGGKYFTAVQHEARVLGKHKGLPGYRVHGQIEKAEDFGVPQKRRRQLIIGIRADIPGYFCGMLKPSRRAMQGTMLGDAIGDLPALKAGAGTHESAYDMSRREKDFLRGMRDGIRKHWLADVAEVSKAAMLTNHVARPHSERDIRDFKKLGEGENSSVAMRRGVEFEFPYDKEVFKDRYTRQHRNRLCSTIVAHLGKDGLMFIHPKQHRSLTPREAARVQTFPDWFVFPEARTHAFRMIGNAVPPLISEAVGNAIREFLRKLDDMRAKSEPSNGTVFIPKNEQEAIERLSFVAKFSRQELQALPLADFLKGWHALFWLFLGLHPDNACDHGTETAEWTEAEKVFPNILEGKRKYYLRSGWPAPLVNIGEEAWRRYDKKKIIDESFYCADVQVNRMTKWRIPVNM